MSTDDHYPTDVTDAMGVASILAARAKMATWWTWPTAVRLALCHQWHRVSQQDRLPVADDPPSIWALEHHLWLFQALPPGVLIVKPSRRRRKARRSALTVARRSKGASGICWSIPSD